MAKAEYLSTMELAGLLCAEVADRIDRALATNDREALREHDFIPASREDLDAELEGSMRRMQDSLERTKLMMTETGRAFVEGAFTKEFIAQRLEQMRHNHYAVAEQKASIIDDVHSGTGPFSPDMVEVLSEMRDAARNIAEAIGDMANADDLDDAFAHFDNEDYKPIAALGLMVSVEMARVGADHLKQATGIVLIKHPLPSPEDVQALRAFAAAHDETVAQFMRDNDRPEF